MKTVRDYFILFILVTLSVAALFFSFDGISSIQEFKKEVYVAFTAK